jgi:hypothetical protein
MMSKKDPECIATATATAKQLLVVLVSFPQQYNINEQEQQEQEHSTHRTPWTSGTTTLKRLLLLLFGTPSIQQRLPTTISAALAIASKTT